MASAPIRTDWRAKALLPMPIDLVVVPYHDWRKVSREGGRTRDAHLIEQLMAHPEVGRVLIVNRPITLPEMVYKRISWKTPGEVCWRSGNARAVQVNDKAFVFDYLDRSIIRPLAKGKESFFSAFGQRRLVELLEDCLRAIQIDSYCCISFNLFAVDLVAALPAKVKLFDGWDNFARFPEHTSIRERLLKAYRTYAEVSDCWTTNSLSNQAYFTSTLGVQRCLLISNGVDPDTFSAQYGLPSDMSNIPRPIVGLGAKVSHLLDCALINHLTEANPDVSFVMVGQLLERAVYRRIIKRPNLFYLGDKPYDRYPAYVRAFDVCIIPYVVGEREHGGDSIKFYEYLAAGKPVVTTRIEGASDEFGNTFIADDPGQFSEMIRLALRSRVEKIRLPEQLTWKYKGNELIQLLRRPPA